MSDSASSTQVLVVGAGPIGLTVANLLADQGVEVLVVEAASTCADEPRAISIVDESLRTLQSLNLVEEIASDLVWNIGSTYLGANGKPLVVVHPALARYGFPQKCFFDQPGLQRALLKGARARAQVTIMFDARVKSMLQGSDQVEVTIDRPDDQLIVSAAYVVGCDGGRSVVRGSCDIQMHGSTQRHPWVVLDLDHDPHDQRMAMFHCDPRRPVVIVPGTQGRCRYEFMLMPGETAEQVLEHSFLEQIVEPYRGALNPSDMRRKALYVSHQLVAERWRDGRVLLAGDAAHLMPPFAGQGLNAGMRDARNLAWKLAAVVKGFAGDELLDTYDSERRPHAVAMVNLSYRMGRLIMTSDRKTARLRDTAFFLAGVAPAVKQYFGAMKFVKRAKIADGCIARTPGASELVGDFLPQPTVIDELGRRSPLDSVLGTGWALLAVGDHPAEPFDRLQRSHLAHLRPCEIRMLPAHRIPRTADVVEMADLDGFLPVPDQGRYLLIRPDRIVAADFAAGDEEQVATILSMTKARQNQGDPV